MSVGRVELKRSITAPTVQEAVQAALAEAQALGVEDPDVGDVTIERELQKDTGETVSTTWSVEVLGKVTYQEDGT